MEKETADYLSCKYWAVIRQDESQLKAKLIIVIWSFKRKRLPNRTLLKHKVRLHMRSGQQVWRRITGKPMH